MISLEYLDKEIKISQSYEGNIFNSVVLAAKMLFISYGLQKPSSKCYGSDFDCYVFLVCSVGS